MYNGYCVVLEIQLLYSRTNEISKATKSETKRERTNTVGPSSGYETYDLIDENAMIPTIEPTKMRAYRQATNSYEEIRLYSRDSLNSNYSAANEDAHQINKKYTPLLGKVAERVKNDDEVEHPTVTKDPVPRECLHFADPISDSIDRMYEISSDVLRGNADIESTKYTKLDGRNVANQTPSGKYGTNKGSMNESSNKRELKPTSYLEIVADELSSDYANADSENSYTKLDGRNVADQTSRDYTKCEGSMNESSIKTILKPSSYLEIVADIYT